MHVRARRERVGGKGAESVRGGKGEDGGVGREQGGGEGVEEEEGGGEWRGEL